MIEPLPEDTNKKLPPMDDSWFDGEKESKAIEFKKCEHDFYLKSATELRCRKCTICLEGFDVAKLLQTSK